MNLQILEEMGMSKNEIKIYLALLKIGRATSWKLTNETKIHISALYYGLNNLIKKGLAGYVTIANKKNFQALPPENLIAFLDNQKAELEKILPELKTMEKESMEPVETNVYEGYKGFKGIYDRLLKNLEKNEEYYVFGARQIGDKSNKNLHLMLLNFHKQREKKGVKVKIIFNKDVEKQTRVIAGKFKYMKYKFSNIKTNSFVLIYNDRVVNFIYTKRLIAIEIISTEISKSYKSFFEEMWKSGKK